MSKPIPPEPIVQLKVGRRVASSKTSLRPKAERPHRQWPLLVAGLLAVLILAVGALFVLRPRQQIYTLRSYEAATVKRSSLTETEIIVGTLTSGDIRPVSSPTDVTVQEVLVQPGENVQVGQLLIRLSSPTLEAARIKARDALLDAQAIQSSTVRNAQNDLNDAQLARKSANLSLLAVQKSLRGMRLIYAVGGISHSELESAQLKVQDSQYAILVADNKLRSAQAALADSQGSGERRIKAASEDLTQAEEALQQLKMHAAIAGRVLNLTAQAGVHSQAGSALLSVANLKTVTVQMQLGEAQAGRIKEGQSARITVGSQRYTGKIIRVASTAISNGAQSAPTVQAEVAFTQLPVNFRLGSSAAVEVRVADHADVLTLPRAAFLSTGNETLAYVLKDGRAIRREAIFGAQNDTQVEVRSGLAVGERVITSSYEAFKDQPIIEAPKSGEIGQNNTVSLSQDSLPGGTR